MAAQGKGYDALAPVYDLLQEEIDPARWADFVGEAVRLHCGIRPGTGDGASGRLLALDLGCGTGSVAIELAARGFDVIGVDRSAGMLEQARIKASDRGFTHGEGGVTLVCQDIAAFELYGTVDVAVCLMDTVNHLTGPKQVHNLLRLCHHYLNPGGLLLFDVATLHHFGVTRGDQVFYDLGRDVAMVWKNSWNPRNKTSRAELALFMEGSDGRYDRVDAVIRERAYSLGQIRRWLAQAGWRTVAEYGDIDCGPVDPDTERVFFAAVKPTAAEIEKSGE